MILCLQELMNDVRTQGYLGPEDLQLLIRLYGSESTREAIRRDLLPYVVNLYNLACTPGVSRAEIDDWLKPANRPDVLQELPVGEVIGVDADDNRELLLSEIEAEIDRLRGEEARVRREIDHPKWAAALMGPSRNSGPVSSRRAAPRELSEPCPSRWARGTAPLGTL